MGANGGSPNPTPVVVERLGNIVYSSWSDKPWSATRADGTFVGSYVSVAEAQTAIETTIGRKGKWTQDVRTDGIVSWTGVKP